VATRSHGEAINLGLNVDNLFCVGFQPGDIDLNIEVTNTRDRRSGKVVELNWGLDLLANDGIFRHD
jgi:hypothetical protein